MKYYVTPITNAEALVITTLAEICGKMPLERIHNASENINSKYTLEELTQALEILIEKGIIVFENNTYDFSNRQSPENDIRKPEIWTIDLLGVNLSIGNIERG